MKYSPSVWLIIVCISWVFAQKEAAWDPVSGIWGDPEGPGFDLKYDGEHSVSGTIRIVNSAGKSTATIKAGSYDSKTGALKLEGEATGPDGIEAHFVIEGRIEKDKAVGTYRFGESAKGEFSFDRLPRSS